MEAKQTIEGVVESIRFYNSDNGYTVFTLLAEDDEITCVGNILELKEGENLNLTGNWIVHPTYGEQFEILAYEKSMPKTEQDIERYLASGIIKGIGDKTAKKIVNKFGENTFKIIEEEPQRLTEISGISEKKAQLISESFHEQKELRNIVISLQQYGITPTYAIKIYKKYKSESVNVLRANPYKLADDVFGIGFKKADEIAKNMGIQNSSPNRIKSGIKYVLKQASNDGNVYLPKDMLVDISAELLIVASELIENMLIELLVEKQIYQDLLEEKEIIYLSVFYYTEIAVAKKLLEINSVFDNNTNTLLNKKIQTIEEEQDINLAFNQKQAVKEAMVNGVLVITGGPGTGKTTTINTIIDILENEGNEIILTAPTGRAAKRMTEATGREAQTIHRLLELSFLQEDSIRQVFQKNEDNPIEADVIIIDEVSMIDILLMNNLLKAITPGTRLILVGDADQLPSVGPGNVLNDIIKSDCIKVVRLNEIFRQEGESAIIVNAHRINRGEYPILNEKDKDFFFVNRNTSESAISTIIELIINRIPNYIDVNKEKDIQVLTPMRKNLLGVNELNKLLQKTLNPPNKDKKEKEFRNVIYRENDKVMQIKNNYNLSWIILDSQYKKIDEGVGVFNGDVGVIISINHLGITVLFDDNKVVVYDSSQLDELELAYAVTIHKSQGSEYPVVIIPILSGPPMLMSRNLLYTAVTRAKKLVIIVGVQEMVNRMIDNNREINRYSSLSYRLKYFSHKIF